MTVSRKTKVTLATVIACATAFFTWASSSGVFVSSAAHAQVHGQLQAKIKEAGEATKANAGKIQDLQVQQAKDAAAIKASLVAVRKELEEQRDDTRQVLRLLMEMNSKR